MTILKLNNVSLQLPNSSKPVIDNINYDINAGDFVILLGRNGSGKSSLMKLLTKQYQPTSGVINLFGQSDLPVVMLNQHCDESLFPSLTIYENYLLMKKHVSLLTSHAQEKTLLAAMLLDFNAALAKKLDLPVNRLSGGEKQALALAFCLLNPPTLLLLDEHTSALDPKMSEQIMRLTHRMLRKHNITCILTTHDLDIALRYGNKVLMLEDGKVLKTYNTKDKASISKEQLLRDYY